MVSVFLRIWLFLTAFFLMGFLGSTHVFSKNDGLSAEKHKLSVIQSKIERNRQKIVQSKTKEKFLLKDLILINRDLTYTTYQLNRAESDLRYFQGRAKNTRASIAKLRERYRIKSGYFTNRVVQIYKNKNLGFLEFIFSPRNYLSVFDATYYFERIIKSDVALINEMKREYQQLTQEAKRLRIETQKIASLQNDISQKKSDLSTQQQRKTATVAALRAQIRRIERENASLLRVSQDIARLIQRARPSHYFGTGRFIHPTAGWVSSPFGYRMHPIVRRLIFHGGTDFAGPTGQAIRAADSGTVIFAGRWGGYGNATIIDHGRGLTTVYGHQSRIVVRNGQTIQKGSLIGYVGSTGFSTGPHLHFEVRVNGQPVNPAPYLGL